MQTHEVFNQAPPLVPFDAARNPALLEGLHREGAGWAEAEVRELGRLAGDVAAQEWGRLANEYPPVLHTHDRWGHRVDEVEFHPHWHDLMNIAVAQGLHGAPWLDERPGGAPPPAPPGDTPGGGAPPRQGAPAEGESQVEDEAALGVLAGAAARFMNPPQWSPDQPESRTLS